MDQQAGRKKPRINVKFRTQFEGRRTAGTGTVKNISESGALIEDAKPLLVSGGRIRLKFSFFEGSLPIELGAVVVRATDAGFAVKFSGMDARLRSLLAMSIARLRTMGATQVAAGVPGVEDPDEDVTLMKIRS